MVQSLRLQILEWLCSDGCEESLRFACAGALAALASDNGPGGLDVACAWLGDLLIYLTRGVVTYRSIREVLLALQSHTSDVCLMSMCSYLGAAQRLTALISEAPTTCSGLHGPQATCHILAARCLCESLGTKIVGDRRSRLSSNENLYHSLCSRGMWHSSSWHQACGKAQGAGRAADMRRLVVLENLHRWRAQVTAPQEVTEAVYANAVSVLPAYARGCAAELRGISERAASWAEPPPHMDDVAPPVSPVPPSALLEARLADPLLCRCLKVDTQHSLLVIDLMRLIRSCIAESSAFSRKDPHRCKPGRNVAYGQHADSYVMVTNPEKCRSP